jgi:hypothetical protein
MVNDSQVHSTRAGRRGTAVVGLLLLAVAVAGVLLTACGDSPRRGAPGEPSNPAAARKAPASVEAAGASGKGVNRSHIELTRPRRSTPTAAAGKQPGYRELLEQQSSSPKSRWTPCMLVTRAQAHGIVGSALLEPQEAPQGPTCIYRSKSHKYFITVAVQTLDFRKLRRQIRHRKRVLVSSRIAYCGDYGTSSLYLPLARGRVLSIAAPCDIARQFAIRAVPRLNA